MSTALILLSEFQKTEIELWLPSEYEGYDVSNLGRVRSWRTVHWLGHGKGSEYARRTTPKIIQPNPKDTGRLAFSICRSGQKPLSRQVHQLVARAFVPNPYNLPQVNHLSGNHQDNRAGNLEWATPQSDLEHAMKHGLVARGERNGHSKLTEEDVIEIRRRAANGETNIRIADYPVSKDGIGAVVRRDTWKFI